LKLIENFETQKNPRGICALAPTGEPYIIMPDAKKPGAIIIKHLDNDKMPP